MKERSGASLSYAGQANLICTLMRALWTFLLKRAGQAEMASLCWGGLLNFRAPAGVKTSGEGDLSPLSEIF